LTLERSGVNTIDFTIKGIKTGGKLFSKLFHQSYRETRACNKGSDFISLSEVLCFHLLYEV
jgi:hypothetical protein